MNELQPFIEELKEKLPSICTARDLVKAGLFKSRQCANYYRDQGTGPPFFKLSKRVVYYPKGSVIQWLEKLNERVNEKNFVHPSEEKKNVSEGSMGSDWG